MCAFVCVCVSPRTEMMQEELKLPPGFVRAPPQAPFPQLPPTITHTPTFMPTQSLQPTQQLEYKVTYSWVCVSVCSCESATVVNLL